MLETDKFCRANVKKGHIMKQKPDHIAHDAWDAVESPALDASFVAGMKSSVRGRGPQKKPTKHLVSLRLDPDIVERFRATGPGWQARINETLRNHLPKP
jgi:uncharacterized protein (DUF4415 family)